MLEVMEALLVKGSSCSLWKPAEMHAGACRIAWKFVTVRKARTRLCCGVLCVGFPGEGA